MTKQYTAQEVLMLISGMEMLIERETSLKCMVDDTGKKKIDYFIKKYKRLIAKLAQEPA